jgi:acyl dehydratase
MPSEDSGKGTRSATGVSSAQEETETFGDLTRDYNPVHYDHRWVRGKGYKDLICHGLLVGSMICEFGGQVGWLATGMNFKFTRAVYPGTPSRAPSAY